MVIAFVIVIVALALLMGAALYKLHRRAAFARAIQRRVDAAEDEYLARQLEQIRTSPFDRSYAWTKADQSRGREETRRLVDADPAPAAYSDPLASVVMMQATTPHVEAPAPSYEHHHYASSYDCAPSYDHHTSFDSGHCGGHH